MYRNKNNLMTEEKEDDAGVEDLVLPVNCCKTYKNKSGNIYREL